MTAPAGQNLKSSRHALGVAARAIDDAHHNCGIIHSHVENSKMSLAGSWQGNASNGFGGALDTWQTKLKALMDSMQRMGETLSGTDSNFTNQEAENVGHSKKWAEISEPR